MRIGTLAQQLIDVALARAELNISERATDDDGMEAVETRHSIGSLIIDLTESHLLLRGDQRACC
jgi:hypothetical protein